MLIKQGNFLFHFSHSYSHTITAATCTNNNQWAIFLWMTENT